MKRAALLMMLLLFVGGAGSPAAAPRPAQSIEADGQASRCATWVEVPPGAAPFGVRFPVAPSRHTTKRPDGRRWELYVAGEGDKIFSLKYRKKGSDEGKWTQLSFDEAELSHRPDKNILWQSACLMDNYAATEELRKSGAGYYWRDLRIMTDGYFYTISLGAKTVEELDSGEAQCFFESFKLKPASPQSDPRTRPDGATPPPAAANAPAPTR
jgi:hypothetical protein